MLRQRMLERRVCGTASLENERGSCVEIRVFIGRMYIQYGSELTVTGGSRNTCKQCSVYS